MSLLSRTKALTASMDRNKAERAKPQAANEGDCNRKARRRSMALPGLITFPQMRVTVPCTIADMSATGARVSFTRETMAQFGGLEHLPPCFTLVMRADRMQVEVQTRWTKPGQIGVRFLSPPKPMPASPRRG